MGVTGLWRLVEPAGKPVPVETLENKVLAVDISIWLHQVVKGYQDAKGAPLPNAHLMGLFQRLCKLLYFRIKPVFVFDGAFPELKKETIAKRQDSKAKYNSESERIKRELAILLSKKTAIGSLLGKNISPKKQSTADSHNVDDIFKLPALPEKEIETESESEDEDSSGSLTDLHSADIESENFKKLSVKEKYDLLVELKETRKMNSWGKLHELPKKSDNFSDYQMQRLLKRRKVQECFQETEKEMGQSGMSLNDLEVLLNEEGIDTKIDELPSRRIASNNTTRYILIQNVKQALADMKKKKETQLTEVNEEKKITETVKIDPKIENDSNDEDELQKAIQMSLECDLTDDTKEEKKPEIICDNNINKKDELAEDLEKAIKMSLECTDVHNATASTSKTDESWTSFVSDTEDNYSDSEEVEDFIPPDLSSAKAYIMQYSDFTHEAIDKIVAPKPTTKTKTKIPTVSQIMEELEQNKSVIVDNVDISSGDENYNENNKNSQNNEVPYQNIISHETKETIIASPTREVEVKDREESILCIEHDQHVITLDSSTDDIQNSLTNKPNNEFGESSSSSDEFEDVPEIIPKSKTVVELELNIDKPLPEDDIFSDIFVESAKTKIVDSSEILINASKITEAVESKSSNNKSFDHDKITINNENQTKLLKSTTDLDKKSEAPLQTEITRSPEKIDKAEQEVVQTEIINKEKQNEVQPEKIYKEIPATENEKTLVSNPITTTELNNMVEEIQTEEQGLIQEKGRLDRIGRNITEQMTREAQELLQIFGIPYIVAPMEAEAQCAFLESANLTDGTITDDSDIWLFGGRNVYKNFFNNNKNVMQFLAERIEKSFNLSREQLILLALLVGSDYTTGLSGVGPVTALEILASFPINKMKVTKEETPHGQYSQLITGLQEFKQWLRAGRRTDNITLKKKLKSVTVSDDFPSLRVVQAYMEPRVDKNDEKFTWGKLDITVIRDYTKAKFGWSQSKLDEIIKPVLKRMAERKSQRSMQDFFKRKIDFQSLEHQMSKRVKAAVQKMGPEALTAEEELLELIDKPKPKSKRKANDQETESKADSKPAKIKKKSTTKKPVTIVSELQASTSKVEIKIPKTDRVQEIIPQREKDIQKLLHNKMKAIEVFRKTNIDKKRKQFKKKANLPKDHADLSESSDSN